MYFFPKYYASKTSSKKAKVVFRHGIFRQNKETLGDSVDPEKIMDIIDEHHSKYLPNQVKNILLTWGEI